MARNRNRMKFSDAMHMVPDDLPDGAYWAMAHEMAGMEYGEGFDEMAEEASNATRENHWMTDHWLKDVRKGLKKVLPNAEIAVFNQGYHFKVDGRFNYYNPRGKWYDPITNEKGKGIETFVIHVKRVTEALKEAGR